MTGTEELQADLLAGRAAAMTPATARSFNLAAWAHYTSAAGTELNRECAVDFARAWVRLQSVQATLAELFDAWRSAGIDVAVFKGLAVASLAYPHPALRHFGDIDVYVPPAQIDAALAALPAGWSFAPTPGTSHAAGYLRHKGNKAVAVDLHRSFFPHTRIGTPRLDRITQRLLDDRGTAVAGPSTFPSLAPVDLALIGLAVNRGWGGDHWKLKTHDYLDLTYLRDRCGLSEPALELRARELGLLRTWKAFARSCNPFHLQLDFERSRQSSLFLAFNDFKILPEKRALPARYTRWFRSPAAARDTIMVMPTLLSVLADIRRCDTPAQAVTPARWPRFVPDAEPNITRGLRWAMRLMAPVLKRQRTGSKVIRAIAEFRLLATLGQKPDWVFGLRRDPGPLPESHAWVEIGGYPLEGSEDVIMARAYMETVRIRASDFPATT